MDCHFRDLPDFQSSEAQLMTAAARPSIKNWASIVFSDPCIAYNKDHYRVQWQGFTIQARHWHWDFFEAGWMLVCVGVCAAEAVINRVSELWKSGKSRKWQSIRNHCIIEY